MSLPVILRPAAEADIHLIHDELEQSQAGLGDRFVARVREVLERIESMPEMYGLVWQDVRAARLRKFRHMVYCVFPSGEPHPPVLRRLARSRPVGRSGMPL
jgi:plasmid stabilization system protein ParE